MNAPRKATGKLLAGLLLAASMLPALGQAQATTNICGRTEAVRDTILRKVSHADCATVPTASLNGLSSLSLDDEDLTVLANGDFAGLTSLRSLDLSDNQLTSLPEDLFDGLTSLRYLIMSDNPLTSVSENLFDGLTSLRELDFDDSPLASVPEDLFDGLTSLQALNLSFNELASLPEDLFDGLTSLERLLLVHNQLTSLPDGLFDGLTNLQILYLHENQLVSLSDGLFDGLLRLRELDLSYNRLGARRALSRSGAVVRASSRPLRQGLPRAVNAQPIPHSSHDQLASLPENLFDGLTGLQALDLSFNELASLPEDLFDGLTSLQTLTLSCNRLGELSRSDPLFAGLSAGATLSLAPPAVNPTCRRDAPSSRSRPAAPVYGSTEAGGLPLFASSSHPMRQGLLHIVNTQPNRSGASFRLTAYNDAGETAGPIQLPTDRSDFLAARLEDGDGDSGVQALGRPAQGDWRLKLESYWAVGALAYVRTNDGFLAAAHDALQRDAEGRMAAPFFNPASNERSLSKLRLVNTGGDAAEVSIEGFDDNGQRAGPVSLRLAAGEARTLSATDLEQGGEGLAGTLGDGTGKWRLLTTAGQAVVGLSLVDSVSGHLTNLSTMGAGPGVAAVPLLEAGASTRSGFVRIVNQSASAGAVRVTAVDDQGNAASPFDLRLAPNGAVHFNAADLENGNAGKGVPALGLPAQGDWHLNVETELDVRVLSYVRAGDGFIAPMHDLMERERHDRRRRLVAPVFLPPGDAAGASRLRLVNAGGEAEGVSVFIVTDDPDGNAIAYVELELAAGQARTLSATDLHNMMERPIEGESRWFIRISAGPSVVGMNLLESTAGHLSNLSTLGARFGLD